MIKVTVQFDDTITQDFQGPLLLSMEKLLRESTHLDVRVFKELHGDDSRPRNLMTPEKRARL